ncbi:hypothetical protein ABTB60_19060, partial [Acinetobacter baumannii]
MSSERGPASSSEAIRNLRQINAAFEILETVGRFRIVRFAPPYFDGFEFWVVNELGFLWEPCDDLDAAFAYLETQEAR